MRYGWILLLVLAACNLTDPATTSLPLDGHLVLAWEQGGNLYVWQAGEAAPQQIATDGVIQAFIAPDGEQIAYTRGAERAPETLWIIGVAGSEERPLVGENAADYQPGAMQIGDVVWLDGETLLFNTLSRSEPTFLPNDDLYAINTASGEITPLLPNGDGGRIRISPDKQHVLLINPGIYGERDGRIQIYDPQTDTAPRDLLTYPAVATASEFPFYPEIDWLPDSSAALVAIPDADAIYTELNLQPMPPVRLWRLPLANDEPAQVIGTVQASFFGLPRWSEDASQMLFLRRDTTSGGAVLLLAEATGADEQVYLQDAGALLGDVPRWIPGTRQFFYTDVRSSGEALVMRGSVDAPAMRLSEVGMLLPQFINAAYYLALFPVNANRLELRLVNVEEGTQQTVAHFPAESIPRVVFHWQAEG
ncbi:MAG: hypothetical protein KC496_02975 [Anaerolineae bacterium]|nr:hypothetical protein [Anaerolineae bacterium]